jgi:hypothetical protein
MGFKRGRSKISWGKRVIRLPRLARAAKARDIGEMHVMIAEHDFPTLQIVTVQYYQNHGVAGFER